jgi:hypothetical protein
MAARDNGGKFKMDYTITPEPGFYNLTGNAVELFRGYALNSNGPFYGFVLTYLVASAGLTPVYDAANYPHFMQGVDGVFPGKATGRTKVALAECVAKVREGALPSQKAEVSLCCMLANTAFESLTGADQQKLTNEPVFQFFRHVRNAASHGNRWHFSKNEPSKPAQWNGITIDRTKQGAQNPLQGKPCFYGELQPADLLYLLQDVERLL